MSRRPRSGYIPKKEEMDGRATFEAYEVVASLPATTIRPKQTPPTKQVYRGAADGRMN